MTLFNTCVDITEKVIKQQTITAASLPIVATLRSASGADITSTLFGISGLNLDASYWTITTNIATNVSDLNFGAAISNYADSLYLRLTASDGSIFVTSLLDSSVETGNELILYSGTGVTLTLDFGSVKLSEAILNLIFKGTNTLFPSALSAKYYNVTNTLQTTIALTAAKWSKRYTGTLGEIFFEYGNTQSLPSINSVITNVRITDASNNIWFEFPITIPTNLKPSAIVYSNSLVLRINDPEINLATYIVPTNANSFFHADFNGGLSEQSSNSKVASMSSIEYNSELKLFGTECLICSPTTNVQYENVVFPNQFTLNCFFYFTANPSNRLVAFAEKNGVVGLRKTVANNLEVLINGSVVITTSWVPTANTWQHIWVQKSATELKLRVNSADINVTTAFAATIVTNTNLFSVCANVLGLCAGIYVESGSVSTFSAFTQPLSKRRYCWDDISFYEWINAEIPQLKLYF